MGDRYYITGVQLGMLKAFVELSKISEIKHLLDSIEEEQYIGHEDT